MHQSSGCMQWKQALSRYLAGGIPLPRWQVDNARYPTQFSVAYGDGASRTAAAALLGDGHQGVDLSYILTHTPARRFQTFSCALLQHGVCEQITIFCCIGRASASQLFPLAGSSLPVKLELCSAS